MILLFTNHLDHTVILLYSQNHFDHTLHRDALSLVSFFFLFFFLSFFFFLERGHGNYVDCCKNIFHLIDMHNFLRQYDSNFKRCWNLYSQECTHLLVRHPLFQSRGKGFQSSRPGWHSDVVLVNSTRKFWVSDASAVRRWAQRRGERH